MNDRECMEAAIARLKDKCIIIDRRPFWRRLLTSLKFAVVGTEKKPRIQITGGTDL